MATVTQHQQQETATSNNTTTGAPSTTTFTPEQRDRQARGKNPYEDPMEYWKETLENYHERERKDFAIAALTSPEKLLMYAQAEDDSVAGQRLRFLKMLHCRVDDEQSRNDVQKRS